MKIAVMGAGGMGGYVGGRLAEVGEEVHFIARGSHLRALREHGLRIESPYGDAHIRSIEATDDPSTIGPVDLVLFTVKLFDTSAAAARLRAAHRRRHADRDPAERHRQRGDARAPRGGRTDRGGLHLCQRRDRASPA